MIDQHTVYNLAKHQPHQPSSIIHHNIHQHLLYSFIYTSTQSQIPIPYSLFPTLYSLISNLTFNITYSALFIPYLFPIPYSYP